MALVDTKTTNDPNWLDYVKLGSGAATGYASAKAQSRAAEMEAALGREGLRQTGEKGYNDAIAQREKDRQDSAASAYKRLLNYDFINQGGTHTPMVSPYSRAVQGPGDNAKRLATDEGIVNELHQRASFGDPYFPGSPGLSDTNIGRLRVPGSDNPGNVYGGLTLGKAGAGETAAGIAGTVVPLAAPVIGALTKSTKTSGWDWLKHLFNGGKNPGSGQNGGQTPPMTGGRGNPPGSDTPPPGSMPPNVGDPSPQQPGGAIIIGYDSEGRPIYNNQQ